MFKIRQVYTYLVSAISLQAVSWAIIALLRNWLVFDLNPSTETLAFQLAVIIIGMPIYLGHWLWAQRLAGQLLEERGAPLRRLYLYGMLTAYLIPFTVNVYNLVAVLLGAESGARSFIYPRLGEGESVLYHLPALLILAILWGYHQWELVEDAKAAPIQGASAIIRRLYILGFSAAGLTMTMLAVIRLARWVVEALNGNPVLTSAIDQTLANEATRLLVGLPLWLIFWSWAQHLFRGQNSAEHQSTLRKLYLYAWVFIGAMGVVSSATAVLAGLLKRLLDAPPGGDGGLAFSIMIGAGLVWAYHSFVLRDDTRRIPEVPQQAGIRRLYYYLVAAVGLAALLIGLGGIVSVILRAVGGGGIGFAAQLREEAAWFTAAIAAGLPVWLILWRQAQQQTTAPELAGEDARRSVARKFYLYFFLFIATMTMLSGAVFVVASLLMWLLGEAPPTLTDLGQAIAFSLIAAAIWGYHGALLRGDYQVLKEAELRRLGKIRAVMVNIANEALGAFIQAALLKRLPGLSVTVIAKDGIAGAAPEAVDHITEADIIIAPANGLAALASPLAEAISASAARKLLLPTALPGWEWIGLPNPTGEAVVDSAVEKVKAIVLSENGRAGSSLSLWQIIAIGVGVVLALAVICPLLGVFIP